MPLDLVQTLSELVATPSVNPMGRPVSGPEFFEYQMTDYLERLFDRLGLRWERQPLEPKRENIIARLDGEIPPEQGGQLIMFEAHQDTVPVDGMTIEPWIPTVRDGRLYGRGSCDIKGGMAAMLVAVSRLAEEPAAGRPTILMACSVNEEHGYSGAVDLARLWKDGAKSIIPRQPDAAVVAEPTNLKVVVAHKGTLRWKCHTTGRAAHSSQPQLGENAIYRMSKVVGALETYAREVTPTLTRHPLCGGVTLSVGTIRGGLSVNTVPDACTIEIDRRLVPGDDSRQARQHVIDFIANYPGVDFEVRHDPPFMDGATLSEGANERLAAALSAVAREHFGAGDRIGVPYGTDASKLAAAGVPSVVFGPGSIDQAHTCDEWVELDEVARASEVLYQFGRRGLDSAPQPMNSGRPTEARHS